MTYPGTSAVWQDANSCGTPRRAFTRFISAASITSAVKPDARRWSTQPPQQLHVGSLVTTTFGNACAADGCTATASVAPASLVRTERRVLDAVIRLSPF